MAEFPLKVWDGRTNARPDLTVVQPPTHGDWLAMVAELQAAQEYILSLSGNMDIMPNVGETIKDVDAKIKVLDRELTRLSPPTDLNREVALMREKLLEMDIRREHARLKRGVKRLFLRTQVLEKGYKDFKAEVQQQLQVLTNNVRNQFTKVARGMTIKQDELQEQIRELQDVLDSPDID